MNPADRIHIDVACNDPDNGVFAGTANMISIGRDLIELEAKRWPPPRFTELGDKIRLAGKVWPILGAKEWVGNWCWNSYRVDLDVAVDFMIWLHNRHLFGVTEAETELFDLWYDPAPWSRQEHAERLSRWLIADARAKTVSYSPVTI